MVSTDCPEFVSENGSGVVFMFVRPDCSRFRAGAAASEKAAQRWPQLILQGGDGGRPLEVGGDPMDEGAWREREFWLTKSGHEQRRLRPRRSWPRAGTCARLGLARWGGHSSAHAAAEDAADVIRFSNRPLATYLLACVCQPISDLPSSGAFGVER